MIRICVMVDLDTDDPSEAYNTLHGLLAGRIDWKYSIGWQSSSEWYREDGNLVPSGKISKAIDDYYNS